MNSFALQLPADYLDIDDIIRAEPWWNRLRIRYYRWRYFSLRCKRGTLQ